MGEPHRARLRALARPVHALLLALPTSAQEVTPPEAFLGRPVGADFELADWGEVAGYHRRLAGESPRVRVETVGTTTEGRDFLLTVVTSEANLARLDAIRADAARIADPRGLDAAGREALLERAVPIVFVSLGMHSTETAAPQFGMELAHRLATSEEEPYASARRELVCLIAPCLNPDGLDAVVEWYRETVGTPFEASGLLRLYQLYAGHDNNRDWFMLSQRETRIVTELLYATWRPQVYWDVHEQGRSRERMFVPPFRDPLNPNLDPGIIAAIDALGSRALMDLTREGLTGVSTGVTYDMWWNGGNRNVPVRHNVVGLLTEAASVRLATPVFLPRSELSAPRGLDGYAPSNRFPAPWPGGWWRLRDIIDYEHAFARSLLGSVAREPRTWLDSALAAATRALERGRAASPRGWILPADNADASAVQRLVEALLRSGVELGVATEEFEADGRRWPAGSVVIQREQPYGSHVKDLFEVQRYPEGEPPYDVAGWTLPLLLGVRRVEAMDPIEAPTRPVTTAAEAVRGFAAAGDGAALDSRVSGDWRAVFERLGSGEALRWATGGEQAGHFVAADAVGGSAPADGLVVDRLPRIGVYAPWYGSMDEGWLRWVLDTWGVPYVRVRNEMLRAGQLGDVFDALVLPSIRAGSLDAGRAAGSVPSRYEGGLDPEGAVAVEEFVRGGGTLVALGSSCAWAIELFSLPLTDVTHDHATFSCPGSVLRGVADDGPWTVGLPPSLPLFFSRSAAWEVGDAEGRDGGAPPEVLLRYARTRVLASGWIRSPEVLADRAAWVRAPFGAGALHLFGFRPQYRGWSQATFQLLFRALVLERAAREAAGEGGSADGD